MFQSIYSKVFRSAENVDNIKEFEDNIKEFMRNTENYEEKTIDLKAAHNNIICILEQGIQLKL